MKEKHYYVAMDDYEHSVLLRSLSDERNALQKQGISTDAVDDLIIKLGNAPQKKFRVVEKNADREHNR